MRKGLKQRILKFTSAPVLFGSVLFGAYMLYSSAFHGVIYNACCSGLSSNRWISFDAHPVGFVFSVSLWTFWILLIVAAALFALFEKRFYGHWRSRQFVDRAIRDTPTVRSIKNMKSGLPDVTSRSPDGAKRNPG